MKIAIDIRGLASAYENRGVGYYIKNLVRALPVIAPDLAFEFFLGSEASARYVPDLPNVTTRLLRRGPRRVWLSDALRLPFEIRASGADLYHCPVALGPLREVNLPLVSPVPVVSTVHDMHVEVLDDPVMAAYRREFRYRLQRWAVRRTRIVTVSEFTRTLLADHGIKPRDEVRVIPNCIEDRAPDPVPKENLVLFVGDTAHKNTAAAVNVFKTLSSRVPDWRFVMVGAQERIYSLAGTEAKELQAARILQIEENVPEVVMKSLYAKVRILFMPSLSEGFGVPVLESFAGGTCVVVSDRGALPEVGGDAAVYVDPLDVAEMVSTLEGLIKNDTLQRALIENGFRRVRKFYWKEHIPKLIDVYRRTAARG